MVDRGNVSFRFIVWGLWICAVNVINLITISFWVVLFFMKTKFLLFLFGQWCICKAAGVRRPERQLCQTGGSQHALPPPTSQDLLPSPFLWYVHTPVSRLAHLSRSMRSSKSHQIAGKPCSLQERWRIIWIRLFFWVLLTFFFFCLVGLVVERIDSCASMYSRSIQGHHVCLLVKTVSEPMKLLPYFLYFHNQ